MAETQLLKRAIFRCSVSTLSFITTSWDGYGHFHSTEAGMGCSTCLILQQLSLHYYLHSTRCLSLLFHPVITANSLLKESSLHAASFRKVTYSSSSAPPCGGTKGSRDGGKGAHGYQERRWALDPGPADPGVSRFLVSVSVWMAPQTSCCEIPWQSGLKVIRAFLSGFWFPSTPLGIHHCPKCQLDTQV